MNGILTFLYKNWQQFDLQCYGTPARLSYVVLTPRFRASSHVIFLVLAESQPEPVLVIKVPRLANRSTGIEREVANLRAVQSLRPGGFDSIPRVVAFEEYQSRPILVETALVGQPMEPAIVRRDLKRCCNAMLAWLTDIQSLDCSADKRDTGWFERLVERPLHHFANVFPLSDEETRLLDRTWKVVALLRGMSLPLVFEHGDLCHPNILLRKRGGVGVVDWEIAEPRGLPACDLFFFLTYAAFALHNASTSRSYLPAFHDAFFGRRAWAQPYVRFYAERMQLAPHVLTPLFILCWARYTVGLLVRLGDGRSSQEPAGSDTAAWLRANRFYALWQHAVAHMDELAWHDCQGRASEVAGKQPVTTSKAKH